MRVDYDYEIVMTRIDGGMTKWGVEKCATPEDAKRECIAFAERNGWTRPKWWQFWRWQDTRP